MSGFIIAIFCVLLVPVSASAAVLFTEVMYDVSGTDTGREWIEVYNDTADTIDLSTFKLSESNTNHRITAVGSASVSAGGYAVIADDDAKFMADNPGFSGSLFTSSFSLSNSGEALGLRDAADTDTDSFSYDVSIGGAGDGNTLQKSAALSWIAAAPTPGSATTATESTSVSQDSSSDGSDSTSDDSGSQSESEGSSNVNIQTYSSHHSQQVANVSYDAPELQVSSGRARFGFVGVPLEFEAKIKSAKNISAGNAASHVWSMGDGTQLSGQFVSHAYDYPGDYMVVLNSGYGGADAVSRVTVKIVAPQVDIISANADYIEISNRDEHEVNIGSWVIESDGGRFIIPTDTIIAGKSSIKLPARATRLSFSEGAVRIAVPSGAVMASTMSSGSISVAATTLLDISPGMSEEAVRARAVAALAQTPTQVLAQKPTQVAVADTEVIATTTFASVPDPISTTTETASVIFAVPERERRGLWNAFIGLFREQ